MCVEVLQQPGEEQHHQHQAGDAEGDPGEDEDARGLPVPRQEEGEDQVFPLGIPFVFSFVLINYHFCLVEQLAILKH